MATSLDVRRRQRPSTMIPSVLADPFERWFRDFDDVFDLSPGLLSSPMRMGDVGLACDLSESPTHYMISIDVPGVKKDDIAIDVSGNVLTIQGERKEEVDVSDKQRSSYSERRYGTFDRSFTLPNDVDTRKVEATCENGVLHVVLPKLAESRRHRVAIKESSGLLEKAKEAMGIGNRQGSEGESQKQ